MPKTDVAVASLPDLTPAQLAKLAREVVMEIREIKDILPQFGVTPAQYARLAEHPTYKRILDAISIDWNCATNTESRIKISAAAILEENLPVLGARMGSDSEPLREAIEAGKLFSRLAGLSSDQEGRGGSDGKFVINIDLGADAKLRFEKETGSKKQIEVLPGIDLRDGAK
jgi:hypothetical protein